MNQRLKLQLAGYVDDGMDYSNSAEVRGIVDASDVAREFYERLLFANKRLESFFNQEMHKTNKKLHKFIDDTLEPKDTLNSLGPCIRLDDGSCCYAYYFWSLYDSSH